MRKSLIIFAISLFFLFSSVSALTKAPVDVTTMSISELLDAMDKGYLTSEVLVNIYLERIEAYDEKFNSINQLNEHAVEQAIELDKEREKGKLKGRLHGIPILVKCNIDAYGMPTTAGTKSLIDNYPKENSFVVQKLIDEGAIILGSTNMSELAFSAKTSYSSYGYVRNVFNTDYTPYGSSGGSAVAVTAAFSAASLGTDTNSSVRLPASGAGLVGIRPTMGLISRTGVIPYDTQRDTVGVLSRTVADNSLLLDIISGEDENDRNTKGVSKYVSKVDNSTLNGITIGVPTQYVKGSIRETGVTGITDEDIYKLVEKSIEELEAAGAEIVYLNDFVKSSNLTIASNTQAGITMCDGFNNYIKGTNGSIRSFEELVKSSGHVYGLNGYLVGCDGKNQTLDQKNERKKTYRDYVASYFEKYELDAMLYPTLKNKVYSYKEGNNISPGSSLGSVIGYPSITVPMGMIDEFSYGIEFFGTPFSERILYNIAATYEVANKNEVITSKLTPSLYSIPSSVTQLLISYEELLLNKNNSSEAKEWINEVEIFLKDYNKFDNVDKEAKVLLEKYNSEFKSKEYQTFIKVFRTITVIMMIISLGIIVKEIK